MLTSLRSVAPLVVLIAATSCAGPPPLSPVADPATVLGSARVYSYAELPSQYREEVLSSCCSYSSGNWDAASLVEFEPESGYFVELRVNREPLINLTYVTSCGGAMTSAHCTAEELTAKLRGESFEGLMLYGKYRSKWHFSNGDGPVPLTERFAGHHMLIYRSEGANDLVVIGPLPRRPTSVALEILNGSPRGNPTLRF